MVDDVVVDGGDGVDDDDGFWRFLSMIMSVIVSKLSSQGGILRLLCVDTCWSLLVHV